MRSNEWAISKSSYYADVWLVPLLWLAALLYADGGDVVAMAIGLVLWTFLEWNIHKHVFHNLYRREHAAHHKMPSRYIGVPWWQTQGIIALAYLGSVSSLGLETGTGFWAGLAAGYWGYIVVHDRFHHGRPDLWKGYWRRQYLRHDMHHRGAEANFGVLTPFWDYVMGTAKNPQTST